MSWRDARAVLLLPFTVTIVVPGLLLWWTGDASVGWAALVGLPLLVVGLVLVVWTIWLFSRVGEGTLAPWDPTEKLVVRGPYRHIRNPMISGVAFVLAGEAVVLGSKAVALWFAAVVAVNTIYIPLVEEPGLRRRFGAEYDAYAADVPRWLPRLRPWRGSQPPAADESR
jgi:protein-S-isoprenylcysteine O-methyltransferase Ste14